MATFMTEETGTILEDIAVERMRQEALQKAGKFPFSCATHNGLTEAEKLGVLAEEFGEVAQHVCRERIPDKAGNYKRQNPKEGAAYRAHLREELIQVAAVCVAWIEALDYESDYKSENAK